MAVGTTLHHRRVLVEERAALLGVAGVAGVVRRGLLEQRRRDRSVRVVAGGARHLPLQDRMARELRRRRALADVTRAARLELGRTRELLPRRDVLHDLVA